MLQVLGVEYALSEVFAKGGEGGVELAKTVCKVIDENPESHFAPIYDLDLTVEEKIRTIAQKIYGADDVTFTNQAMKSLKDIKALGGDALPVCIAKTQYSLSDDRRCSAVRSASTLRSVTCASRTARASWLRMRAMS